MNIYKLVDTTILETNTPCDVSYAFRSNFKLRVIEYNGVFYGYRNALEHILTRKRWKDMMNPNQREIVCIIEMNRHDVVWRLKEENILQLSNPSYDAVVEVHDTAVEIYPDGRYAIAYFDPSNPTASSTCLHRIFYPNMSEVMDACHHLKTETYLKLKGQCNEQAPARTHHS